MILFTTTRKCSRSCLTPRLGAKQTTRRRSPAKERISCYRWCCRSAGRSAPATEETTSRCRSRSVTEKGRGAGTRRACCGGGCRGRGLRAKEAAAARCPPSEHTTPRCSGPSRARRYVGIRVSEQASARGPTPSKQSSSRRISCRCRRGARSTK